MRRAGWRVRLALWGVPGSLRESVHGDLLESGGGWPDALAIALHFQAEPYRAAAERRAVLCLMAAAAGLLWIVPMAAQGLLEQAAAIGGPVGRLALWLWGAPAAVAALACGLLVGRASLLPPHADAARWHGVLALMPWAAWAAPDALQALAAAALLMTGTWLGNRNRRASAPAAA